MNEEQFNKFMKAMTKSVINKQRQKGNELIDLKKSIEGLALNYATLSAQLKNTRVNQPHNYNKTKTISFCEIEETNNDEVYTLDNITSQKTEKCLADPKWEGRLRKEVRMSQKQSEREQNMEIDSLSPVQDPTPLNKTKGKQVKISNSGIEDLKPREDEDDYSKDEDTFDEFDYEEKKFDEIEQDNNGS
ncbi:24393_t:CDS:2 [Gigaspora margarita]|uniref:24393_t:CDS:1 n=1 Tax=Gigaspora margarita TaxID=4874 RepID=A0ABM8VW55_GIGMA|nr:24393_t:CDS:2 [Gigaspora margarita]